MSRTSTARIRQLVREGCSISRIQQETGAPKSTIYYHYRQIRGRKYEVWSAPAQPTAQAGEIVGVFTGDGSFSYYQPTGSYAGYICFSRSAEDYATYVQELFETFFGRELQLVKQREDMLRLRLYGKPFYDFFTRYLHFKRSRKASSIRLASLNHPREFLKGFLKGLVDTDGSVWFRNGRPRTEFCTSSGQLAHQIALLLEQMGCAANHQVRTLSNEKSTVVDSTKRLPLHRVRIRYTKDSERFNQQVVPWKYEMGLP